LLAWLTENGTGYGQAWFQSKCLSCNVSVTKEGLAVRRLITDLKKLYTATSSRLGESTFLVSGYLLTGLSSSYLLNPPNLPLPTHPLANFMHRLGETVTDIEAYWHWTRRPAMYDLALHREGGGKSLLKLMSAYIGAESASVDLVATVSMLLSAVEGRRLTSSEKTLRHSTFVAKLKDLGWLEPSRWEENAVTLQKAIERYTKSVPTMQCKSSLRFCFAQVSPAGKGSSDQVIGAHAWN
jgi:hypothetical protein